MEIIGISSLLITTVGVASSLLIWRYSRRSDVTKRNFDNIAELSRVLNSSMINISNREKIVLEETLTSFYGDALSIEEILVLYEASSPSKAIREYIGARKWGGVVIKGDCLYLSGYWKQEKRSILNKATSPWFVGGTIYALLFAGGLSFAYYAINDLLHVGRNEVTSWKAAFDVLVIFAGLIFSLVGIGVLNASLMLPDRKFLLLAFEGVNKKDSDSLGPSA